MEWGWNEGFSLRMISQGPKRGQTLPNTVLDGTSATVFVAKMSRLLCSPFHETDSARSTWLRSPRYCNGDLKPSAEWGAAAL